MLKSSTVPLATQSRIRWYLTSICLVLALLTSFCAMNSAPNTCAVENVRLRHRQNSPASKTSPGHRDSNIPSRACHV
eukprot:373048-Prorocentrum_minimum.AAC.1